VQLQEEFLVTWAMLDPHQLQWVWKGNLGKTSPSSCKTDHLYPITKTPKYFQRLNKHEQATQGWSTRSTSQKNGRPYRSHLAYERSWYIDQYDRHCQIPILTNKDYSKIVS
jgi:hypothetical protein